MSRIGKRILSITDEVKVNIAANNLVTVEGPKGTLVKQLSNKINITVENNTVKTERSNDQKHTKQLHGTTNSLLKSMIEGVTSGFVKKLEIQGVGYRAKMEENVINLSLGFSHPVLYTVPEGIKVECINPVKITVSGIDKQLVGQVAANIREFKKPEPYKGKGIRYENETVIRKEGKKAGK